VREENSFLSKFPVRDWEMATRDPAPGARMRWLDAVLLDAEEFDRCRARGESVL
jgi:hypothetical protein